jgi:metal-responsive CopG/Arc/MetJ family transcriptional regulator
MAGKKVVIYMPEALFDALNRVTVSSPHSRSEIICAAVERYLTEQAGLSPAEQGRLADAALYERVSEMIESGLLSPEDFAGEPSDPEKPKNKLWIN